MLSPQQYAAPAVVTPHAEYSLALSAAKVSPPDTSSGVVLVLVVPLPSWPLPLKPQQYPVPAVVTPQAKYLPALTAAKLSPPVTATGVGLLVVVPLPSSPLPL